ncbi:transporter substrate-binding domain-containing protein [Vibrio coralliilyticus OCN008]|uniref:substrate-binding periplasmic protein n=1 Tax=Vibrio coralliilyticus TaxID=190893 RepID=UPI0003916E86|nr:transporter substrate-binding domain-containing protein [Vibrio coralliilyticus]ERB62231.1 amino acid ABC transporter substrate-binding protein [Vibrio coralliilyticus OCN008]QIJ84774.1 transporter substrate-binding domain-containing protein [Vibrio coralliilyticus OCN008]
MRLKLWLVSVVLLMVTSVSYASDNKRIKIVSQEWLGYTNSDGTGLYWEIVKAVFQPLNVPLTLEVLPWKRAKHLVRKQEASAYLGDYFYPNADAFLYPQWHLSVEEDVIVVFARGSLDWEEQQLSSLVNKKVAWVRGYGFEKGFLKDIPLELVEVDSAEQGMKLLKKGRVSALIDYPSSMASSELLATDAFVTEVAKKGEKLYVVFSNTESSNTLIEMFDTHMPQLIQSGELKQIYLTHGQDYEAYMSSIGE